jgi:membrane protease YdiL (CAAX protease family)
MHSTTSSFSFNDSVVNGEIPPLLQPEGPTPSPSPPSPPSPTPSPAAGQRRVGWWIHWLLMAALPIAVVFLGMGRGPFHGPALTHSVRGLLYVCSIQVAIFGILFLLAWVASRASGEQLLLGWRPGWWVVPLGLGYSFALRLALLALGLIVVAVLLLTQILSSKELEHFSRSNAPDVQALVDVSALRHNPVYLLLTLTVVSFVLAGLREELWRSAFLAGFRRLWPRFFSGHSGEMKAIVLAAMLFGAAHAIQGPLAVVMTAFLGVGLGAIMVFHRSIWPAVFAHGFFDAASIAAIPLVIDQLQKFKDAAGH